MIASEKSRAADVGDVGAGCKISSSESSGDWPRSGLFVFLAGLGLWLLSHPYWGIWHDARVYTLMAVRWIDPEPFARDPWFMFGSQDAFSLFSPLYGSAIAAFGINAAAKWGSFLAGTCFVVASWVFSRALPLGRQRDLVFLLLVSVQLVYDTGDWSLLATLRISETFITSRQFAVSFGMIGVAAAMASRRGLAASMSAISMALHPLMGLWPLVTTVLMITRIRYRWVVALVVAGSVALIGLSMLGSGIFRPVDGEWGALVRNTSRIVFVTTDDRHRVDFLLICYSLLLMGACWGQDVLRRWYKVVLLVSVAAYAVNWFCSTYFPAAIVMQAQLWRANWFALVLAVVAAVDIAVRVMSVDRLFRYLAMAAGSILVLVPSAGALLAVVAACCPSRSFLSMKDRILSLTSAVRRTIQIVSLLVIALLSMVVLSEIQATGAMLWRVGEAVDGFSDFFRGLVFVGGFGLFAAGYWIAAGRKELSRVVGAISVGVVVIGLWQWDDRIPFAREFDETNWRATSLGMPRFFSGHVGAGDVVYWQGRAERVWFELRTASYASSTQAIGIVFSEEMALGIARRLARVALAATLEPVSPESVRNREDAVLLRNREGVLPTVELNDLHSYEAQALTIDGLKYLCEDRELDFVIHDELFPAYVRASVSETFGRRPVVWHLYDCAHVRQTSSGGA